MHHFHYKSGELHCENVSISSLTREVGSPFYVYSTATIERHVRVIREAFSGLDPLIAYSVKANSNLGILSTLAKLDCGADVVSSGELRRAIQAGMPANKMVFSGVGKTKAEIQFALKSEIWQFNVESLEELETLSSVAASMGVIAPVALRVNPDVIAGAHPNISTGKAGDKFGVPWTDAPYLYNRIRDLPNVKSVGIDVHIGSQIGELPPMRLAFQKTIDLSLHLRREGHEISQIDFGGGLGIPYESGDTPATPAQYAGLIKELVKDLDIKVIIEPGRVIVGNAGILVSQIIYTKEAPDRTFLILDAGLNDLMRPSLYGAHHDMIPVIEPTKDGPVRLYDIVGPICESTDKFASNRELPTINSGEFLAIMSAGAYGAVLSSQYNSRPLVPEILVKESELSIVRERPSFEQMIALESIPTWLN